MDQNTKWLTKEMLTLHFKAAGLKKGDALIVHGSLKALGFVFGGAETVVSALLEVIGDEGTLMSPAQTWKNLDPSTGVHWLQPQEWWPLFREHWPAFNKDVTPSIGMGAIAEMVRTWPNAKRSDHPARSFSAIGKHAKHLTDQHDLKNIFGEGSPLAKLYALDGKIVLLGVDHNKNTSLHLAETRADFPKKYVTESSAITVCGKREWVSYETLAVDDEDFLRVGRAFEAAHHYAPMTVGEGQLHVINQRQLVDFAQHWFTENRK